MKKILPQIKLIADINAVNDRLKKDKSILNTYERLLENLLSHAAEASKQSTLQYWREQEEILRIEDNLKHKKEAVSNIQNRADEWEVDFERNSNIVNDNFEQAITEALNSNNSNIKELIRGYEENKESILSEQQNKNNLYYQIVNFLYAKR